MRIRPAVAFAACLLAALLAAAPPAVAEDVANPAYDAWKNFKPGASATIAGGTKTMGIESALEIRTRLVEITPKSAVVEVVTVVTTGGNRVEEPAQKKELPATTGRANVPPPVGEETITVNGKQYACKVYVVQKEQDGTTVIAKSWMSDQVPGGIVKIESATQGAVMSDTRFELKDFKQ